MDPRTFIRLCGFVVGALATLYAHDSVARATAATNDSPLKQGDAVTLGGRRYVLTKLDTLPYVENDYSKRFTFDRYDNPKLKDLREQYHLDEVVAGGKDELDRQVLLLDWVNH